MEIQVSIKIYPHLQAKLLALGAIVGTATAIVGVQVLFPQVAQYVGCLLLLGLFAYATQAQPSREQAPATPAPRWATPQPTATATHTPAPIVPAKAKSQARKAAAPRARMLAVPA